MTIVIEQRAAALGSLAQARGEATAAIGSRDRAGLKASRAGIVKVLSRADESMVDFETLRRTRPMLDQLDAVGKLMPVWEEASKAWSRFKALNRPDRSDELRPVVPKLSKALEATVATGIEGRLIAREKEWLKTAEAEIDHYFGTMARLQRARESCDKAYKMANKSKANFFLLEPAIAELQAQMNQAVHAKLPKVALRNAQLSITPAIKLAKNLAKEMETQQPVANFLHDGT